MLAITEAKTLPNYCVWLKFSDGVEGKADLSELAGKGVFSYWLEGDNFSKVTIGSGGELNWGDVADLCPDELYMKVTGMAPEQLFPILKAAEPHA